MADLIAQADAILNPGWQTVLLGYGPLGVLALVVLWMFLKYFPRMAEAHITLANTCSTTQVRMADAIDTMSETHTASTGNHVKTQRAIGHLANAAKESTTCQEVQKHLDRAIDELSR